MTNLPHLAGVERPVEVFKPRVAEGLHRVPGSYRHVGLGVDDVAVLLYHLEAMALKGAWTEVWKYAMGKLPGSRPSRVLLRAVS